MTEQIQTPVIDDTNGVLMSSQTEIAVSPGSINNRSVSASMAHDLSMPDSEWSFQRVARRPLMLGDFSWSVSQAQGTTLASFDLPSALFPKDHFLLNVWKVITFLRCGFKLRFLLNSTRFHQGAALAFFVPLRTRQQSPSSVWSKNGVHLYNATALQHVWLDASQSADASIVIPYQHIQTFLTMYGDFTNPHSYETTCTLGTVYVDVLSQLAAATGASTSVYVQVYIEFLEPYQHVPLFPHFLPTVPQGLEGLAASVGSNVAGQMFNQLSGLVPEQLQPLARGVLDAAPSLIACLDRPQDPNSSGSLDNAAAGDSLAHVNRLALGSGSVTSSPARLVGADAEELSIAKLARIPTIIREFLWNTTDTFGTNLGTIPVHPSYWLSSPNFDFEGHNYYYLTPSNLAAISAPFVYWKGSITFTFRVVSSTFHSGRLRISFCPQTDTPTAMDHTESLPQVIFDLKEEKMVKLTVPFVSPTPWKEVASSDLVEGSLHADEVLGAIDIKVSNPLTAPNNVSTTVALFVSVSAGDDFAVMGLGPLTGGSNDMRIVHHLNQTFEQTYPQGLDAQTEASAINDEPTPDGVKVTEPPGNINEPLIKIVNSPAANMLLGGDRRVVPGFSLFEGVHYTNVRDVLKRHYMLDILNFDSSRDYEATIPVYPLIGNGRPTMSGTLATFERVYPDAFSHFVSLYAMWRGSMRYRFTFVASNVNSRLVSIRFRPANFNGRYITSNVSTALTPRYVHYTSQDFVYPYNWHRAKDDCVFGVEIPYTSKYVSHPTAWWINGDFEQEDFIGVGELTFGCPAAFEFEPPFTPTYVANVLVEYGGGDDFLPFLYCGPVITQQLNA